MTDLRGSNAPRMLWQPTFQQRAILRNPINSSKWRVIIRRNHIKHLHTSLSLHEHNTNIYTKHLQNQIELLKFNQYFLFKPSTFVSVTRGTQPSCWPRQSIRCSGTFKWSTKHIYFQKTKIIVFVVRSCFLNYFTFRDICKCKVKVYCRRRLLQADLNFYIPIFVISICLFMPRRLGNHIFLFESLTTFCSSQFGHGILWKALTLWMHMRLNFF